MNFPSVVLVDFRMIFSRLTLLEAARTSIVSHRWRYLWTFTADLDFHAPKTLWNINAKIGEESYILEIEGKRSRYINWVDKVLELHRGKYINEFRLYFDLADDQKSNITNWIHTALAKGVQKLELKFDRFVGLLWKEYSYPIECYNTLKTPHGLSTIHQIFKDRVQFPPFELPKLRHLIFEVNVGGYGSLLELTRMIKACPFLHKFTVKART
ncbi:hypothetical protein Dsin_003127 [Dipteronia sinensis]|uniref:F-box domain-containing protein n=1 Tax=Dipteronia sinensis TaxID=43782 RepID=A0AAE0EK27_9ROSI|nr:hypothetical protein Dsin_003127 [Dipteronia sinensis]